MPTKPPSTDWKEVIPPGEAEKLLRHAEALRDLQDRNVREGVVRRALHAKGLGGLECEFKVLPSVPEYARVGLFATPSTYRGYARFSNGSGLVQSDRTPDERTRTYIMVDSIAESLERIQAAGGRVLTPRTDIGPNMGAFAAFADPVGNEFGLYEEPQR